MELGVIHFRKNKDLSTQPLPSLTAEKLSAFFMNKVAAVRTLTRNADPPTYCTSDVSEFSTFRELTPDEVRKILLRSPQKHVP